MTIAFRPFNLIVTNIPGPGFPLYLLESRLLRTYPMVPLYVNQAVGIAIVSYDGGLYFGLNGDADSLRDLPRFVACLLQSFREIEAAYIPPNGIPATTSPTHRQRSGDLH